MEICGEPSLSSKSGHVIFTVRSNGIYVKCIVTSEALQDLASKSNGNHLLGNLDLFKEYKGDILEIIQQKIGSNVYQSDGSILVCCSDIINA